MAEARTPLSAGVATVAKGSVSSTASPADKKVLAESARVTVQERFLRGHGGDTARMALTKSQWPAGTLLATPNCKGRWEM